MDWEVAGVVNDGYLMPDYPHHDPNYVPDALIGVVYGVYSVLAVAILYFGYWVYVNKPSIVVRLAQPFFLYLVLLGCAVGITTLVPLTFDHSSYDINYHDPNLTHKSFPRLDAACEAQLWLLATGFAITFPALFVKTWRLAKIVEAGQTLRRIKISERDCSIAIGMLSSVCTYPRM